MAEIQPQIEFLLAPAIFRAVDQVCRRSIDYGNHPAVRSAIVNLYVVLSKFSRDQYGTETADVRALHSFLQRTDPRTQEARKGEVQSDPLQTLMLRQRPLLTPEQHEAALQIRQVWAAFGRFLIASARDYEKRSTTKRSKVVQPMDVMGQDVYELWRHKYSPWFERARRDLVPGQIALPEVNLVLDVVVDCWQPRQVEARRGLSRGIVMPVLRRQLQRFCD